MYPVPSGRPTIWRLLRDTVSEWTGAYRLAALRRRIVIALSARIKSPSRFAAGRGASIQQGSIIHCGGKIWSDYGGYVRIGEGVAIGPYCILYGAGGIELGDYVHLGPGVKLMSQAGKHDAARVTDSPTYLLGPITIGRGSWIGAGAVILGGARLGECVSVAPNAVVSGEIPSYAVVAGNPARIVFMNESCGQ